MSACHQTHGAHSLRTSKGTARSGGLTHDPRLIVRFWSKVDRRGPDECWEWKASRKANGYGQIGIGRRAISSAHRLSYFLHYGPIPDGASILHSCDNRACQNPRHLRPGSAADNYKDMVDRNRRVIARGEQTGASSITAEVALAVWTSPLGERDAASAFGTTRSVVRHLRAGRSWTHVTAGITPPVRGRSAKQAPDVSALATTRWPAPKDGLDLVIDSLLRGRR